MYFGSCLQVSFLPKKNQKGPCKEINARMDVPDFIWNILDAFPKDTHPMTMLSALVTALGYDSKFKREYDKGLKKDLYWDYTLEDSLDLIAKMPVVASAIYRKRFGKGDIIKPKKDLDWGANYAYMLGIDGNMDEWYKLMRMYMVVDCDHESGNVSAFAFSCSWFSFKRSVFLACSGFQRTVSQAHCTD